MGTFASVTWQTDDEVTSQKLGQMAQNDDWLKDNLVRGDHIQLASPDTTSTTCGRPVGLTPLSRMEAFNIRFDSGSHVSSWDITIDLPPVFTAPPICVGTVANNTRLSLTCKVINHCSTSYVRFRIFHVDLNTIQMTGSLNVVAFGY